MNDIFKNSEIHAICHVSNKKKSFFIIYIDGTDKYFLLEDGELTCHDPITDNVLGELIYHASERGMVLMNTYNQDIPLFKK